MSDHALRRLERAWRETGAPAAERAFRLAEVRAGARTRASLADLAVLQLPLKVVDRAALARVVEDDPLLRRLALKQSDHLFGPSVAYLRAAAERIAAETSIVRVSWGRPRSAVRYPLAGETLFDDCYWPPWTSDYALLKCRARARAEPELVVAGSLPGVPLELEQAVVSKLHECGVNVGLAVPYWNGLDIELLAWSQCSASYDSDVFRWAAWRALQVIRDRLGQKAEVPWVRVPGGRVQRLARALHRGRPWELVAWRPLTRGAGRGRPGSM